MTSMFDYDDSLNLAYNAKVAGKAMIAAKYEVLSKTGDFLFLAHSEKELALRCQMVERDIEQAAYGRLASVSDSKAKLVRAIYDEWSLRHASCEMCKTADDKSCKGPSCYKQAAEGSSFCGPECQDKAKMRHDDWAASQPKKTEASKTGTCVNCKETTSHARGGQWHCPSGAGCQK